MKLFIVFFTLICSLSGAQSIYETAKNSGQFNLLLKVAEQAGLSGALKGTGKLTILAPNDKAFEALPSKVLEDLLLPKNKNKLADILKFHVLSGEYEIKDLLKTDVDTLQGQSLKSSIEDGQVLISDARVIANDLGASNGIIHVIDKVLIPSPPMNTSAKIKIIIESAIDKGVPLYNNGNPQACADVYSLALESIMLWDGGELSSQHKKNIKTALNQLDEHKASNNAWALRKLLDKVYASLSDKMEKNTMISNFKPIVESAMPKGFPSPGPVGTVVLKEYPAYRAAQAESSGQSNTFMKLFYHIKSNGISMTAPVEMQLDNSGLSRVNMSFLYANQGIGDLGDQGNGVEVKDLPAKSYLSYGIRGGESKQKIVNAIKAIESFLVEENKWKVVGEPRLLGYNSPMVPQQNRFWEVQIPVERK